MRQAVLSAPKSLRWQDSALPAPGPGEIVVRIRAALTCGTDLKTYRRGHPKLVYGPFGHEASGDIVAVGSEVTGFAAGEPVMWVQTAPCGDCARCRAGNANLCDHLTDGMALGAYADYLKLPSHVVAYNLFHKPAGLSYIEAAFLEPLACVVHGWNVMRRANAQQPLPPEVAIIGAGTIGLLHLAYAQHAGLPATMIARQRERLALAEELGARATFAAGGAAPVEGRFTAVIDCGGTAESWTEAVRLCAPAGRVLFFSGLPTASEVALDATRVHYDELTLMGSFHFTPGDVREARDLLIAGVVPARKLISGVLPLDALAEAFENLDRRAAFKYALIPAGEVQWT